MRTTLTLDPDVAARLKELAHQQRTSFKAVVNGVLRRGLSAQDAARPPEPFTVEPHASGLRTGVDAQRLNQLADELEVEDFLRESGR